MVFICQQLRSLLVSIKQILKSLRRWVQWVVYGHINPLNTASTAGVIRHQLSSYPAPQWFIMDANGLRQNALKAIENDIAFVLIGAKAVFSR